MRKKYQINYNPSSYNVKTRQYESKEGVYINYKMRPDWNTGANIVAVTILSLNLTEA